MSDEPEFFTDEALPAADPAALADARSAILGRHVLAMLRTEKGMSQTDVAANRGVTKAAVHQVEKKPLGSLRVSSVLSYLQGLGYDVDEDWLARTLCDALPTPTSA